MYEFLSTLVQTAPAPAQELDPGGKFRTESNVWEWAAMRDGTAAPFSSCCSAAGFSSECTCSSRQDCTSEAV